MQPAVDKVVGNARFGSVKGQLFNFPTPKSSSCTISSTQLFPHYLSPKILTRTGLPYLAAMYAHSRSPMTSVVRRACTNRNGTDRRTLDVRVAFTDKVTMVS